MAQLRCPICNQWFDSEKKSEALPFCSPRCKQIDLGRWLDEGYSLPFERSLDDPDEPLDQGETGEEE